MGGRWEMAGEKWQVGGGRLEVGVSGSIDRVSNWSAGHVLGYHDGAPHSQCHGGARVRSLSAIVRV